MNRQPGQEENWERYLALGTEPHPLWPEAEDEPFQMLVHPQDIQNQLNVREEPTEVFIDDPIEQEPHTQPRRHGVHRRVIGRAGRANRRDETTLPKNFFTNLRKFLFSQASRIDFGLLQQIYYDRKHGWFRMDAPFILEFIRRTHVGNEEEALRIFREDLRSWKEQLTTHGGREWHKWDAPRRLTYVRIANQIMDFFLSENPSIVRLMTPQKVRHATRRIEICMERLNRQIH